MKTLLDAQKLCVSPMLGGLERFVDKTTSGRVLLKVHHTLAWIVLLVRARAWYFIFDYLLACWLLHVAATSASCTCPARDRQHYVFDPLAAQFQRAQRQSQTCAAQSFGKCERTLGSASKASNRHITCEVHWAAGLRRNIFQLKLDDAMCAKPHSYDVGFQVQDQHGQVLR